MLFRKKIAGSCSYCVYAGQADEEQMLCRKKGFVPADFHCRRFRYDPLKRIPLDAPVKDFSQFDDNDFSL